MSQTTPGWYPDPAGKFGQRYHDGNGWTEHVVDAAGNQSSDPVPPAPPAAGPPPGAYGGQPTQAGFGGPATPPPGAASPGFGAPPPQQAYGQAPQQPPPGYGQPPQPPGYGQPQPFGQAPQPGYGQPQQPYGQVPFGSAPASGGIKPTYGVVAAGVGMLLVLLGLFAFDWARVQDVDGSGASASDLGDLADAVDGLFFASLWGSFLYLVGFLVAIALTVLALKLPAVQAKVTPQLTLIAGGVLIFFAAWNLITIVTVGTFEQDGAELATAFGAWFTLVGWGALAVQFVPQFADKLLTK